MITLPFLKHTLVRELTTLANQIEDEHPDAAELHRSIAASIANAPTLARVVLALAITDHNDHALIDALVVHRLLIALLITQEEERGLKMARAVLGQERDELHDAPQNYEGVFDLGSEPDLDAAITRIDRVLESL